MVNKSASQLKAQLAHGSRKGTRYPPEQLAALRRDYHAIRLEETLRRIVKEAGPFTAEQAQTLAAIITKEVAA